MWLQSEQSPSDWSTSDFYNSNVNVHFYNPKARPKLELPESRFWFWRFSWWMYLSLNFLRIWFAVKTTIIYLFLRIVLLFSIHFKFSVKSASSRNLKYHYNKLYKYNTILLCYAVWMKPLKLWTMFMNVSKNHGLQL